MVSSLRTMQRVVVYCFTNGNISFIMCLIKSFIIYSWIIVINVVSWIFNAIYKSDEVEMRGTSYITPLYRTARKACGCAILILECVCLYYAAVVTVAALDNTEVSYLNVNLITNWLNSCTLHILKALLMNTYCCSMIYWLLHLYGGIVAELHRHTTQKSTPELIAMNKSSCCCETKFIM